MYLFKVLQSAKLSAIKVTSIYISATIDFNFYSLYQTLKPLPSSTVVTQTGRRVVAYQTHQSTRRGRSETSQGGRMQWQCAFWSSASTNLVSANNCLGIQLRAFFLDTKYVVSFPTGCPHETQWSWIHSSPNTKINSKWITDLQIRSTVEKLFEEWPWVRQSLLKHDTESIGDKKKTQ